MKKISIRNEEVSSDPVELDIKVDIATLNLIQNAFRPDVVATPPKGYYSADELSKMLKISKSQIIRRIRDLKKNKKIDEITALKVGKKFSVGIPYYKILS